MIMKRVVEQRGVKEIGPHCFWKCKHQAASAFL